MRWFLGSISIILFGVEPVLGLPMVKLWTISCFGACPIYELIIEDNGSCEYVGKKNVSVLGRRNIKHSEADLRALLTTIRKLDFFKLKDRYSAAITDQPTTYVSVRKGEGFKTVEDYYQPPQKLKLIENAIEDYCKLPDWLGVKTGIEYLAGTGRKEQLESSLATEKPSLERLELAFVSAVRSGWFEIADILRAKGATPDFRDDRGRSLLFLLESGSWGSPWAEEAADYLKRNGAKYDAFYLILKKLPGFAKSIQDFDRKKHGDELFYYALDAAKLDTIELLIKAGFFPNSFEEDRFTWICQNGTIAKIKMISEAHEKVRRFPWSTCLLRSLQWNRAVAEYSLKMGADVNARIPGLYGTSDYALFAAIRADNLGTLRWLVENGANVNTVNDNNFSGIHQACSFASLKALKFLVSKGADVNMRLTHNGESPLDFCRDDHKFACTPVQNDRARCTQHEKIIEYLIKIGAKSFVHKTCQSK